MDRGRTAIAQGQPGHVQSSRLARATLNQPAHKQEQSGMVAHAIIQALGRHRKNNWSSRPSSARILGQSELYMTLTQKIKPTQFPKQKWKIKAGPKKKSVYTAQEANLQFMHAEFYQTEMALGRLKAQKWKQNFFGTIYKKYIWLHYLKT